MAFNFPNSPTVGQTYSPPGGPVYQWDGAVWKTVGVANPEYSFVRQQVLLSSGAISLHADTKAFQVEVQGGGAGGGACNGTSANQASPAPGGGSGGYASKWIIRPAGTFSPACTIGSFGTNGAAGGNSVYNDGTNLLTASGGSGGGASGSAGMISYNGGGGGAATGGDINIPGSRGGWSIGIYNGATTLVRAGTGGGSRFGDGGLGFATTTTSAQSGLGGAATGNGAGGGGAGAINGGWSLAGGSGTAGLVIVTEYR
jgi:hypothetical protein